MHSVYAVTIQYNTEGGKGFMRDAWSGLKFVRDAWKLLKKKRDSWIPECMWRVIYLMRYAWFVNYLFLVVKISFSWGFSDNNWFKTVPWTPWRQCHIRHGQSSELDKSLTSCAAGLVTVTFEICSYCLSLQHGKRNRNPVFSGECERQGSCLFLSLRVQRISSYASYSQEV